MNTWPIVNWITVKKTGVVHHVLNSAHFSDQSSLKLVRQVTERILLDAYGG